MPSWQALSSKGGLKVFSGLLLIKASLQVALADKIPQKQQLLGASVAARACDLSVH